MFRIKNISLGKRLFGSILLLFIAFAAASILLHRYTEMSYRRAVIAARLQAYNTHTLEVLKLTSGINEQALNQHVASHEIENLRLTVIDTSGNVIYDNISKDYAAMTNHLNREEVGEALATGHGTDTERLSSLNDTEYFYSATYFPADSIIIRSALPYDNRLVTELSTGPLYAWITGIILIVLVAVLMWFINRTVSVLEHQKTLERLQVRRELTQNIAHELKTPITGINGYLETLITQENIPEETRRDFLEKSLKQTQLLAALVRDISIINRLENRFEIYTVEDVDLCRVVDDVISDVKLMLDSNNIRCVRNTPEHAVIEGNYILLCGIFRNLLDNVIIYAGKDTVVNIDIEPHNDCFTVILKDNGPGVPAEALPFLFDRFYRVDKGRERALGSTGLGLSIVKNAVLFHGGTIEARNLPAGGLSFNFTLCRYVPHSR